MIGWIELEDGYEEEWHFQTEKRQAESPEQNSSIPFLGRDEKVIQVLADSRSKDKIISVLKQTGLDNYVIYDGDTPISEMQPQNKLSENRLALMVAVKSTLYSKLLANFKATLNQKEQENFSCTEAVFQVRLGEESR
ncbi:MAG: hypothetical protein R3219_03100 [Hydrogenovibrio sp.]|nr:hypothetical protein [Hydrogenovibrio sp.]